jgi:GNAT superfamily N-acetyltransferase
VSLEIHPATADRFDDVATLLAPKDADAPACWCLYFRLSSGDFGRVKGAERRETMRRLTGAPDAPGVIAYRDGQPVGWCALGPRDGMGRLQRSRTIPLLAGEGVWSIVCFVVAPGHRRQGVAGALLAGAVEYARSRGAVVVEGYPAATGGERISTAFAYTGTETMFRRAGFTKAADTTARTGGKPRIVMRRRLR